MTLKNCKQCIAGTARKALHTHTHTLTHTHTHTHAHLSRVKKDLNCGVKKDLANEEGFDGVRRIKDFNGEGEDGFETVSCPAGLKSEKALMV